MIRCQSVTVALVNNVTDAKSEKWLPKCGIIQGCANIEVSRYMVERHMKKNKIEKRKQSNIIYK